MNSHLSLSHNVFYSILKLQFRLERFPIFPAIWFQIVSCSFLVCEKEIIHLIFNSPATIGFSGFVPMNSCTLINQSKLQISFILFNITRKCVPSGLDWKWSSSCRQSGLALFDGFKIFSKTLCLWFIATSTTQNIYPSAQAILQISVL